jgi:DNA-directed RNA polymerase subunit RPC12/RpoP
MASISTPHQEKCPRCGSRLVSLEWDERINAREVQDLWQCWNCKNKFITTVNSEEKERPVAEIIAPFFTSLVIE